MNYRVLARKYRPSRFSDIVGQKHVVRTLLNALKAGRVAHAYLFCGARGVGKTSAARIFAKTLNCPNSVDFVPCCDCDVCNAVAEGDDIDVVEMDAASNRGIDDIRSLRENASFRPARSPYKIYIIDEVHMLTREAFNALLKTLEEPPDFVKFIFCTTEPERIPPTILSRCQRFDFHRLGLEDIAEQLASIAKAEGYSITPDALTAVARYARGGLRDSISVLEQLFSFSDSQVTVEDVQLVLGAVSPERVRSVVYACARGDAATALSEMNAILDAGRDSIEVLDQLTEYLRDCLVAIETRGDQSLLTGWVSPSDMNHQDFKLLSSTSLLMMMGYLFWARQYLREDSSGRSPLEIALIRMAHAGEVMDIPEIIKALGTTGSAVLKAEASGRLPEAQYVPTVHRSPQPPVVTAPAPQKPQPVQQPIIPPPARVEAPTPKAAPAQPAPATPPAVPEPAQSEPPAAEQPAAPKTTEQKLAELWYDFLVGKGVGASDREVLAKCLFTAQGDGFTMSLTPAAAHAADKEMLAEFQTHAKTELGLELVLPGKRSGASPKTLNELRKDPVIATVLELFPGARITGVGGMPTGEKNG